MASRNGITIIVPVLNEVGNIQPLIARLTQTLQRSPYLYEVLFIDDHSTDGTIEEISQASLRDSHIVVARKENKRGKSFSIIEGIGRARYDTIAMIDADLQYAPENILPMLELLTKDTDMVLSTRIHNSTNRLRKLSTIIFHAVFTRLLYGINFDTQSGLKVFRKSTFNSIELNPSAWSFDLEFIVRSLLQGFTIKTYDISFGPRQSGSRKISLLRTSFELAFQSVKLRLMISGQEVRDSYKRNALRILSAKEWAK